MKKKICLFSYYLQKLAQMEQERLGLNDFRAGLLAVVLTKAHLFRRFHTGCTTQELYFCNPQYAQELFVYICLKAKGKGNKLCSMFDFAQTMVYRSGMWGQPYVEDKEITKFLGKVFPEVGNKGEIENSLYAQLLPETPENEWLEKFIHIANFCKVDVDALAPIEDCEETAIIDAVIAKLKNDKVLLEMLSFAKCDMYGVSSAYHKYFSRIREFPKNC